MSLAALIEHVADSPRSIRVYSPDPVPDLAEHFETTAVTVEHVPLTAAADSEFVTIREGDEFLGGASLAAVRQLLDPPVSAPWDDDRRAAPYRELLDLLADVTFVGFDHRQMLAVSREIEDRAWRIDDGELHATFTPGEALEDQLSVYEHLTTREGLAVHVYVPESEDEAVPSPTGVAVHAVDPAAIDAVWSVAYLGGNPVHATALVGEAKGGADEAETDRTVADGKVVDETSGGEMGIEETGDESLPGGFVGGWTDDRKKVETVIETISKLAR